MMRTRHELVGTAVLLALLLSGTLRAGESEDKAVKFVESLGGKVKRDAAATGQPVVFVNLLNTKVTDAGLKELKEFKNLQTLYLCLTPVTDAGLKELKDVKSLQKLYLIDTNVTDTGLKELAHLTTLQRLDVRGTHVTNAGVADLQKALPKLTIVK